jgi:hypothetical protein
VLVPAFQLLWTSLDDEVGHVRRFRRASLAHALTDAGFDIEAMRYFDCLGFAAALGVRLWENVGRFPYGRRSIALYDRLIFPVSRRLDGLVGGAIGKNLVAVARRRS